MKIKFKLLSPRLSPGPERRYDETLYKTYVARVISPVNATLVNNSIAVLKKYTGVFDEEVSDSLWRRPAEVRHSNLGASYIGSLGALIIADVKLIDTVNEEAFRSTHHSEIGKSYNICNSIRLFHSTNENRLIRPFLCVGSSTGTRDYTFAIHPESIRLFFSKEPLLTTTVYKLKQ